MRNSNARQANAQTNGAYRMDKQCSTTQTLKTKKGEEVNLIQIVDFNGREVFRSNNKKAAASWKPEANQPKGLYNVNVETNQRKISSRLIRQ